ncbi:MAG: TRCF domain-containing protein [Bacteroidota bacterium]
MYQKILDEAMVELQEEANSKQLAESEKETNTPLALRPFIIRDCIIDTDLEILIPDEYVENITERVTLYQQLDNCKTEKELSAFENQLKDRFGTVPEKTKHLLNVVRLRWKAMQLGFEKLILKKEKMTGYFTLNKNSPYFQSEIFSAVIKFVQQNPRQCRMREENEKLSLVIERINNVDNAFNILNKMQSNQ